MDEALNNSFEERTIPSLISYVKECFERAKASKQSIEQRMIRNLYTFKCKYTPEKLKYIRQIGGSEIFLPLANIKARALKAWLTDIFFNHEDPPFDIKPTPIPELTSDIKSLIRNEIAKEVKEALNNIQILQRLSGGVIDISSLLPSLKSSIQDLEERARQKVYDYSQKLAEREKKRINDQFIEGGFYDALDECLLDMALYPCAFMKSCVPKVKKVFSKNRTVIEKVIPFYSRVSPFDIFPSPSVSDFSDWVIEILHLSPYDLLSLRNIDGYNSSNIEYIVDLYGETGYSISDYSKTERFLLEGKRIEYYNLIDVIEFWGTIKGSVLLEADVDIGKDIEENKYYDIAVWVCDDVILRCILNPDPLGMKPYHKASFIVIPDSFWGYSLIDVIHHLQEGVNSIARSIINNSALSSGPMVERNIDKIPPTEDKVIVPWKIFDSSNLGYDNSPAYRFYQPSLTAPSLVQVIMYFMKLADELSGIGSYAHGDVTVGGAGRTASGLSMLMANASRGIKEVVKNIDRGLIEPTVLRTYYFNVINFYGYDDEIPDLNIQAKGSIVLMEKTAQIQKLIELLNIINNPLDNQIVGVDGRKVLLEKIFRNFGVDIPFNSELDEMINYLQNYVQNQTSGSGKAVSRSNEVSPVITQAQEHRKNMINMVGALR